MVPQINMGAQTATNPTDLLATVCEFPRVMVYEIPDLLIFFIPQATKLYMMFDLVTGFGQDLTQQPREISET